MDYYKVLGVTKTSDKIEIKKAYKKLVLRYHPYKNRNKKSVEKFRIIHTAYKTLLRNS